MAKQTLTKDQQFQIKKQENELESQKIDRVMFEAQLKAQTRSLLIKEIPKWFAFSVMAICVAYSVHSIAGKTTTVSFFAELFTSKYLVNTLSILFGIGGTAFGLFQKKLYKETIKEFAPFRELKEKMEDANRDSTRLGKDGHTNPGDKE